MAHTKKIKQFLETVEYATLHEITDAIGIERGTLHRKQMKQLKSIGTITTEINDVDGERFTVVRIYNKTSI